MLYEKDAEPNKRRLDLHVIELQLYDGQVINSFMAEFPIYRKQFVDSQIKSMDCFLYGRDLRHERVKGYGYERDYEYIDYSTGD